MSTKDVNTQEVVRRLSDVVRTALISCNRTCVTCLHFDKTKEVCTLYENVRPPATVIAYGCDSFEDDIPF